MRKIYNMAYEGGKCPLGWEYIEGYSRDGIWVHGYCRKINSRRARREARKAKKRAKEELEKKEIESKISKKRKREE